MSTRFVAGIQYVGTNFKGWARQKDPFLPTIEREVNMAFDELLGERSHSGAVVSSRTDSGVHALRNTFHVDIAYKRRPIGAKEIQGGINHFLAKRNPRQISILDLSPTDETNFHARFSATGRVYLYRILCTGNQAAKVGRRQGRVEAHPMMFDAEHWWCVPEGELDVERMRHASALMEGLHDFTSFRGKDCVAQSPVRTVDQIRVDVLPPPHLCYFPDESGDGDGPFKQPLCLLITVRARSFLHRMVRNLVGSLYHVGRGSCEPEDITRILKACDRASAPSCAPANGLFLKDVSYKTRT